MVRDGKIIKGIAGFYYVHVGDGLVYECKARGVFRKRNEKPLVGDNVEIECVDDSKLKGNIISIKKRQNQLIRPEVAGVDQAMVIFAMKDPDINFNLLDRFLLMMEYESIPVTICFNKADLADKSQRDKLIEIYKNSGAKLIFTSTYEQTGIEELKACMKGKTTVLAGPSGVGKSSITNLILKDALIKPFTGLTEDGETMETGEISRIGMGRHTTRHSQLFAIDNETFVFDTPGFTSLMIPDLEKENLRFYFPEFEHYEGGCRFNGCLHMSEPDCAVKQALEKKEISQSRYDSYADFFVSIKDKKKVYDKKN